MDTQHRDGEFLDLVYGTALEPGRWGHVADRLAKMMGGHAAAFRSYDLLSETGVVLAPSLDAEVLAAEFKTFASRNPLKSSLGELAARWRGVSTYAYKPGWKMDVEWLPKAEFVQTEYYNALYRPRDIHSDISIGFAAGHGIWSGIDVYRTERQGAFTDDDLRVCDAYHPDMIRALDLGRRLSECRALGESLGEMLDRSPHALFVLSTQGRVTQVSARGQAMLGEAGGLRVRTHRLTCADTAAARRLEALVAQAGQQGAGGSMALTTPTRVLPLSITVAPLPADQVHALTRGAGVLVCVTDLEAGVALPEDRARELFGLTPSEARVAALLFEGLEPKTVAGRLDLSIHTVRIHMAHIFQKTETAGQVDLARLMTRLIGAPEV